MLDSFVYQYAIETLIFGFGIYCGIRTGVLAPNTSQGRRRLFWLITGFVLILLVQGVTLVWGK